MNHSSRKQKAACFHHHVLTGGLLLLVLLGAPRLSSAATLLFENLQGFASRLPVGDPTVLATNELGFPAGEGPKDVAVADLNGDSRPDLVVANKDGTVTLYLGSGNGHFGPPTHLQTAGSELRGLAIAPFTTHGQLDIAVGAPYDGKVFLFANQGDGTFTLTDLPAWRGARDLAAGDFDGDGAIDLAVAGSTNGVAHYRNLGGGNFELKTNIVSLGESNTNDFPQPAFYLKAFRPAGASRDELAFARAQRSKVNVLAVDADGRLAVQSTLTNISVNALDVGPLLHEASSGIPDLVVSHNSSGTLQIHASVANITRFAQPTIQRLYVPGGPRNVRIVDLDGDGWNDLVVVQQSFNKVLTFRNLNGFFVPTAEAPVGAQPREMDLGDFNDDGHPDVAVLNHDSTDVSILITYPGSVGFGVPNSVYPVDGEVSGLELRDFNNDGRADVIQVHRASGEMSVRLAGTNGVLDAPTFYPIGQRPIGKVIVDVNHDGIPDIITADMVPYIIVKLGLGDGHFGPSITNALPDPVPTTSPEGMIFPSARNSQLFSVEAADFDADGDVDVAVGFWDCRLGFFRGHGDGTFTFTRAHSLFSEPRAIQAGDFDGDDDVDLVCASLYPKIAIMQNFGNMLTRTNMPRVIMDTAISNAREIRVYDANHDDDPDLLIVGGGGTQLFLGGPEVEFHPAGGGSGEPVTSVATADFNSDGNMDIATSCAALACVSISLGDGLGQYTPFLTASVPSARFLATGDIDGDGLPDLAGTGEALWVALSGHRAVTNPPSLLPAARAVADHPVINEILAANASLPLAADGDRFSDWVEIFNGAPGSVSMSGWRLQLIRTNVTGIAVTNEFGFTNVFTPTNWVVLTNEFIFPTNATMTAGGHQLIICTTGLRSPFHTGFNLPSAGGSLRLLDDQNVEVDRVDYPAQQPDISWSRFRDGMASFMACNFPTPGEANTDNGPVPPTLNFDGVDLNSIAPGQPIRFFARSTDDVGVMGVVVLWKRLDIPNSPTNQLILNDDGMSGDGAMLDGLFSGTIPGLPAGAGIQFFLQAMDVSEFTVTAPGNPTFATPGQPVTGYSLAIGAAKPPLEISEVVADNRNGLQDESGGTPDWIEIRNCSTNSAPLTDISLSQKFFGTDARLSFTNTILAPGQHLVIFADNNPAQGALHAPFSMNRDGDQILLTGRAPDGTRMLIDSVSFGAQAANVAWSRLGCAGPWRMATPTPRAGNVASFWTSLALSNTFLFAYPTATNGFFYTVEYTDDVAAPTWNALPAIRGNGLEQTVMQPLDARRFFRVRRQ